LSLQTSEKILGQADGEPIEAASRRAVWEGSPEHLDGVLSEQEGIRNTIEARTLAKSLAPWM
jgi:hypothetical protein